MRPNHWDTLVLNDFTKDSDLLNGTDEKTRQVFDRLERIVCGAETDHKFAFHDDDHHFHTCHCTFLEVFYVRA